MAFSASPVSSKSSPSDENTFKPHTKPSPLERFGGCFCFGYSSRVKIDARFDSSDIRAGTQTAEMSFTSEDIVRAVSEEAMGSNIMKDIQLGTRNFSNDFKIDQGGFRTAYKGKLKDEILVAMERREEELRPDISNLALTKHANLVMLLGFLESGNQRIIIHEFFPNVTLREYLDGGRLDFYYLSSVAVDAASGVLHLHNSTDRHPIIHGDINSSNILITDGFRGKVKLPTHGISPIIKGTAGYSFDELMEKDVCSFGELLVEMMSGWRAIVQNRKKKESDTAIVASKKILHLASQCQAKTGKARPTMSACETMLQSIRLEYKNTHSSSS